jgi:subtilisin
VRGHGGEIKHSYHLVPAIAASLPEQAIEALAKNPNVTRIEPDGTVEAVDYELDSSWGVKRIGAGFVQEVGGTGAGVNVAVIDSGIDYHHEDLDGNYRGGYDCLANDDDPMDEYGHGTHVAGIIAAEDNGIGVVGVAPQANLYALRVLGPAGSGTWGSVIAALDWAVDHGMQVANLSLGDTQYPGQIVEDAFYAAAGAGVVVVAAAGNAGNRRGTGDSIIYPARWDCCIAVGATDSADRRATFSSTGPALWISAPGVSVNSTLMGGGYGLKSGTSMASPHVAGVVALMIAKGVGDVKNTLASTAMDLGDPAWDPLYGSGLVNAVAAVGVRATEVYVTSVSYATGKGKDRNTLSIRVTVVDDLGSLVAGAGVSIETYLNGDLYAEGDSTTGTDGKATFVLRNAPSGTYTTLVTYMTMLGGLVWDGQTPENGYTK